MVFVTKVLLGIFMKIFLDFDNVFVNARKICRDYFRLFVPLGVPHEDARVLYEETKCQVGRDDPRHFAKLLYERFPEVSQSRFERDLLHFKSKSAPYVFSDSRPFLERLQSKGLEIFVVSYGDRHGQLTKVSGSGLREFFKDVVIVPNDNEKADAICSLLNSKSERGVFVDDSKSVVDHVKERIPHISVLHLTRFSDQKASSKADVCVRTLDDVFRYIEEQKE
tara:strand:+ start:331 stop:999 length:669 start_codon:yes stop_codon:yes gene_type:complete